MSNQPIIFEVDTRPHLTAMGSALGREASLEDIPDDWLGYLASLGIQYIWFMGVWQLGPAGKAISQSHSEWRGEFRKALPDLQTEDITGSPYAIASYQVDECLGGNSALAGLRQRMKKFGLKLCLDFVPNHTGIDHPWVHD
ncbi:MAG: alpha-amylase family glycosyl hydrolase, partial [Planctomycetia bacterium]